MQLGPILTPEFLWLLKASVFLCALCPAILALHIQARLPSVGLWAFWRLYLVVVGSLGCLGAASFGAVQMTVPSHGYTLLWTGLGLVGGLTCTYFDEQLRRWLWTRRSPQTRQHFGPRLGLSKTRSKSPPFSETLVIFTLIAVFEELVFRGTVLQAMLAVESPYARIILVVAAVFLFALNHLAFGWDQVAAKLPLSALTTLLCITAGSLVPSIAAHVAFNARAAFCLRTKGVT